MKRFAIIGLVLAAALSVQADPDPKSEAGPEILAHYQDAVRRQQDVMKNVAMDVTMEATIPKLKKLLAGLNVKTAPLSGAPSGATGFTVSIGGPLAGGIQIASKDDKFAIAYGSGVLEDALDGGDKLGDSQPFKTAAGLLEGVKPSLFLDTPQVVKLIAAFAGSDEDFAKAKPTLDAFGPAAAGMQQDGDVMRLKAAVQVP